MKQQIIASDAPQAIGPYSQGVEANGTMYVSGQLPLDPETGAMPATIEEQARQSLCNVMAILGAAGLSSDDVVKTTILLKDIADFSVVNEVYAGFFSGVCPARACYAVADLPKGALIEIEAIAVR